MATFGEAFDEGVQTAFCNTLPSAISGGLLFAGLSAETGLGALGGIAVSGAAALAYAQFCNRELPPEDIPQPPFHGGQCEGVSYRITTHQDYHRELPPLDGTQGQNTLATGRISAVDFIQHYSFRDNTALRIVDSTGTHIVPVNPATADSDERRWFTYDNLTVSIARVDGGADTCGNPPPIVPVIPPGSNTVNQPITYNNREGDTITNNYNFTFGYGQVNLNGQLGVPISVVNNVNPDLNFSGDVNLQTGDINLNFNDPSNPTGSSGSGSITCVVDPSLPAPTLPLPTSHPLPPSSNDKPERAKILRGAVVTTTHVNEDRTEIFQNDNPDIFVPDLGFIQFLVQVGDKTAWTTNIRVNCTRQIIECPWVSGAIDVKGTPRPLCEFTITPIYTQISYPKQYPPES